MQIGLILLYISPLVVPSWILFDSKKRVGRYSWGVALMIAFALGAFIRHTLKELELQEEWMTAPAIYPIIIWGKVIAAYLIPVVIYRTVVRGPNGPTAPKEDDSEKP